MLKNWFAGCIKVAEIKALFRELAMQWHPDRGGDLRTMQEINAQYQEALKAKHLSETFDETGEKRTYYYNECTEREIIDVVSQLVALNIPTINIEIIGLYVWVTGDTKPVKDRIKTVMINNDSHTMRFHSVRNCWFFKPEKLKSYRPRYSGKSLDELADKYGRKTVSGSRYAPSAK